MAFMIRVILIFFNLILLNYFYIVRFLIETKVRVYPAEERWLLRGLKSKSQSESFYVSG